MGLFSRKNPYEQEVAELEALERAQHKVRPQQQGLPPASTGNTSPAASAPATHVAMPQAAVQSAPLAASPKLAYGIEDVIRLMRDLPNSQHDVVVSIVQKTLMSMKVDIASILEDASRKIDRLNKKNDKLSGEIRELEDAILKRRMEMEQNSRDVQETSEVQGSFQAVYATHVGQQPRAGTASTVTSFAAGATRSVGDPLAPQSATTPLNKAG